MTERAKTSTRRHTTTPHAEGDTSPTYVQLAGDALLGGMTREQAIAGLISRIKRDQGYLAYRKACNRRTSYDDQVRQDMRALALAAVLLEEVGPGHLGVVHDTSPTLMPRSHLGGVGQGT